MWMVNNLSPYAADRCWTRDRDGSEIWLVAAKATFLIDPDGRTSLASDDQLEVFLAPEFRGDPTSSSLLYDADLYRTKTATDVLLNGSAYAPGGEPASEVDVRLRVGEIDKRLRIFGDRVWKKGVMGISPTKPEPFVQMPITYERAFGGHDEADESSEHGSWEWKNPVGQGFAVRAEHLIDRALPNVEDPEALITAWNSRPAPVGFGPIAAHWEQRAKYGGTYDEEWERNQMPLLPADFDDQYYQCAPEDQQVAGFLKGGEVVELENLTASGSLRFSIPQMSLGFETEFLFEEGVTTHRPVLHTVVIEPDVPRVVLVWQSPLACHHKVQQLLGTTIRVKDRVMAAAEEPE